MHGAEGRCIDLGQSRNRIAPGFGMAEDAFAPSTSRAMPMNSASILPHLNAIFNGISIILLVVARVMVAHGRIEAHRVAMLSALGVSALFLISYIAYHLTSPIFVFRGHGVVRPIYYALLISHVVLAAAALPLILVTARLGLKRIVPRHTRWARWVWPLWMYVSLSGLTVYLMLYRIEN